jgi:hypothetical protein
MENQHKLIKGYRDLSPAEIALMNEVKAKAAECGELVQKLRTFNETFGLHHGATLDQRWVSIGATDLQTGFMALVRAVARPDSF